jgi:trimeric autotransporter adhesin
MKLTKSNYGVLLFALLASFVSDIGAGPIGTAFTYQGRLASGTNAANGLYDFSFALFDDPIVGTQRGPTLATNAVPVTNGLFTVTLDFGSVFDGNARWLAVWVETNGGSYTALTPRQSLTPTPYAVFASSLSSNVNQTFTGTVSFNPLSGPPFTVGNSTKVLNLNADLLDGLDSTAFWQLAGNAGTTPGVNFLGTVDNQPLELKVYGQRALRLEPNTSGAPNTVGGAQTNSVANGVVGATIGGGGAVDYLASSLPNRIEANFGTIGGGYSNAVAGANSTVGGGRNNSILEDIAHPGNGNHVIGGGWGNTVQGRSSHNTVGGGARNTIGIEISGCTLAGGNDNKIGDGSSTIAGGISNVVEFSNGGANPAHTIGGGRANYIRSLAGSAVISGGSDNSVTAGYVTVGGGFSNRVYINADYGTIGGGRQNIIETNALNATIGGGLGNTVRFAFRGPQPNVPTNSVIGGGYANTLYVANSVVGGGVRNGVGRDSSRNWESGHTIGGGDGNSIDYDIVNSTISGGTGNFIGAPKSTIAGGSGNSIVYAGAYGGHAIGGGNGNVISAAIVAGYSVVGGGNSNAISRDYAVIGGGFSNRVDGLYGCVPGGDRNSATHYAFAAGRRAKANHQGAFVWADSTDADIASTVNNQFTARAAGGVIFYSDSGSTVGVQLATGANSWSPTSDRNAKENFETLNYREVLQKLEEVPVSRWNLKSQPASVRHIGPMAQDFEAAFAVGEDNRHISTSDADGVALAAIKGLNEVVKEKDARIAELERGMAELKAVVKTLAEKVNGGGR